MISLVCRALLTCAAEFLVLALVSAVVDSCLDDFSRPGQTLSSFTCFIVADFGVHAQGFRLPSLRKFRFANLS